jgi:hypothetical protein
MQVASKDAKKLAYVLVEAVNKEKVRNKEIKTAKDIDKGLFEGILVHLYPNDSTRTYIVLSTAANKTVLVDTEFYNILSIEAYDGMTREYLFCRDTEEDQIAAFSELSDLLNVLTSAGRTVDGFDLVNLACYTDLPKHFTDNINSVDSKTDNAAVTIGGAYSARHQTGFIKKDTAVSYNNTQTAADSNTSGRKVPTFFTRKSKLPHWKTLDQVKNKLKALATGEKIEAPLPETDTTSDVYCSGSSTVTAHNDIYVWD